MTTETPMVGPPPAEVPLDNAPLIRVIGQVRFPIIAALGTRDFDLLGGFQEAIRGEYPVLREEPSRGVVLGPSGPVETQSITWRFHDIESKWRITLAPEFLAIETTDYESREDFLDRFRRVLEALQKHINPSVIDRIGMRYIDRIVGEHFESLELMLRPDVLGISAGPLAQHLQHTVVDSMFTLPEGAGQLKARWGRVPAGSTVDPSAIDKIDKPSWILDLDAFVTETRGFEIDAVMSQANRFAERVYSVFRWCVTDEFLRRHGGKV